MSELAPPKPLHSSSGEVQVAPRVILFATDFSSACDNAWPYALALANDHQSKLLLAHVIDPNVFAGVPAELMETAREQVRNDAEARIRRLLQHNGFANLDFEWLLQEGEVSQTLIALIEGHEVDLLVTATRGYSRTERLLLGSVAEKLFRQVRCPVLVVPEQANFHHELSVRRILCPIDFSTDSPAVLACASSVARHYGAQLILMHVLDDHMAARGGDTERTVRDIEDRLRELLDQHHDKSVESHTEILFGVPAERISRVATEYGADLIILSVHTGSETIAHEEERTAYRAIRWSPCPVLTIPRPRV